MLVVLQATSDRLQNPRVISRISKDVDAELLEDGDRLHDMVHVVEYNETGRGSAIAGRQTSEHGVLQGMHIFLDRQREHADQEQGVECEIRGLCRG